MNYVLGFITKIIGTKFLTPPTFISYQSAIALQYLDNIPELTSIFPGRKGNHGGYHVILYNILNQLLKYILLDYLN